MNSVTFPDGKRFAFTIMDDTDAATVDNVRPIYDLLRGLGMLTTKTVWPLRCPEGSPNFGSSQTLEDKEYRDFVLDLRDHNFEIAWHCATMETSKRERTLLGLERFHDVIGYYPRVHANHAFNRENLYWGSDRLDRQLLKKVLHRATRTPADYYQGHVENSPYWWGDACLEHIDYVRNLTFDGMNLCKVNPSMPYQDPKRPCAKWWFSCCDAENCAEFKHVVRLDCQEQLAREGGWCIIATHFAKGYVRNGQVDPQVRMLLEALAARNGWFVPVATLLDHLRTCAHSADCPTHEWDAMQWKWAGDLVRRRVRMSRRTAATPVAAESAY